MNEIEEWNNAIFILVLEAAWYCCVHWSSSYQRYYRQSTSSIFLVSAFYRKKRQHCANTYITYTILCAFFSAMKLIFCSLISYKFTSIFTQCLYCNSFQYLNDNCGWILKYRVLYSQENIQFIGYIFNEILPVKSL